MRYLWDTDICIQFLNGNQKILRKTQVIGAENICTTIINIFELKFGAYNSTRIESNLERIEKFQLRLTILDNFDDNIGTFFAKNKAELRKKGITICDFDLIIASFAIVNNLRIVTKNTKHFKHIPGVNIENWLSKES
jgi:tRNA(fMet)-specific endonuclease VapC